MMKWILTLTLCVGIFLQASAQETALGNLKVAIEFNKKKEFEASIKFCDLALEQKPDMSDAWFLRGFNNFQLENYKEAIVDFSVTLNFQPEYIEAYYYRGKSKQADGNLLGAFNDFNKARELNPSRSAALFFKGVFTSIFGGSNKKEN